MKNILIILVLFLFSSKLSYSNISLEGLYQGRSLFVQCPTSPDGFGFCVSTIRVNENIVTASPQANTIQLDFTELNLGIGDYVFVVFETEDNCHPKVLNPEVLLPASTFIVEEITCSSEGVLSWSASNESGKLTYQIEQYKWNKWITVGEVEGTGTTNLDLYEFILTPHSGENKVRVSQIDNSGRKRVSKEVSFFCDKVAEPEMVIDQKTIRFIANGSVVKTKFEIFDAYGNIVKKGFNSKVDCSNLKTGFYYINYDNKSTKFIQK